MKNFLLILLYFINNVLVLSAQGTPGKWGDQGNGTYINPILNADYSARTLSGSEINIT